MEGVKKILEDFSNRTTMHGMGTLSSAGSLKAKLFWSGVCLGSLGMFLFMLSGLVIQYLSFPVMVNVQEVRKPC